MKRIALTLYLLLAATALGDPGPVPRPPVDVKVVRLADRLQVVMVKHGADPEVAREVAPLLAGCRYPRIMTAIAINESRCDPRAVGADGEVSMFQVLRWPGGDPTNNAHALQVALDVFEEKRSITGSVRGAIRAYNGAGPDAYEYRRRVLALVRSI